MGAGAGGNVAEPPVIDSVRHRLPVMLTAAIWILAPRRVRGSLLGDLAEEFVAMQGERGAPEARRWAWQQLRSTDWLLLRGYHHQPRKWFGARGFSQSPVSPRTPSRRESPLESYTMKDLIFDLKSALRTLRHQPRLAVTVIATVAIGVIGAAATLAVIDTVLWKPLPYFDAARIVALRTQNAESQISDGPVSVVNMAEWGELDVFHGVFAVQGNGMTYRGGDHPENLNGARISPGTLATLGVEPQRGRRFVPEEGVTGGDRVVIISDHLWQTRFNRATVLGTSMLLDDEEHTIVGILPEDFRMPIAVIAGVRRDFLLPLAPDPESWPRKRRAAAGYARLADGVSVRRAQQALDGLFAGQTELDPEANEGWTVSVLRFADVVVGPFRVVLMVMLGAAALLLLLAAVNLINLMLVHGLNRQTELAVRASLGAARPRLIRSLLTEGVVLGILGGLAGLVGAVLLLATLKQLTPGTVPRLEEAALSVRVIGATIAASGFAGLLFGGIPALLTTRSGILGRLVGTSRGMTLSPWQRRAIDGAATIQVALAVMLLIGAGLLGRSFMGLVGIDPGFNPSNVVNVQLVAIPPTYADLAARTQFVDETKAKFAALPGVSAVGVTNFMPYSGANTVDGFTLRDMERTRSQRAGYRAIDADYLDVVQIEVTAGRAFTAADIAARAPVALINESMAATFFPDTDPIGQGITRGGEDEPGHVWLEIVGVVTDVRHDGPDSAGEAEWYATYDRDPYPLKSFVIRTAVPPEQLLLPVRSALAEIDPFLAPFAVQTMDQYLEDHIAGPRFNVATVGAFAVVAILLAAIGMVGVIANSVSRRIRETGIRMALGARGPQVRNRLVAEGLRLAVTGTVAGLMGSFFLARLLASLLRGVGPRDPATFLAVAIMTLVVAAVACYLPARRAAQVDPALALRAD